MTARKLPPYGRQIAEALRGDLSGWWGTSADGKNPSIIVCCGSDAWTVAREWHDHRLVTLCPPDADPWSFDWRFCAASEPLLLWRCGAVDGNHLMETVRAILSDGTNRIFDIHAGIRYRAQVKGDRHERAA
ncbi:hypothetical protein [Thioalkalivibrio thiocyanodenitrificans]|uniref:hypothetical protein n=1 Tax=Thioalkalivibrio thiocyanodenitrificans TaxID=243063 RepID=UPI00035F80EE|nr:hypothetical protein [Thioalkalivibrio thiocyanodenitrificans]